LLSSIFVGVAIALTSAVSLAATALIVPGTGTPNANVVENFMENAVDRYMQGTFCGTEGGCDVIGDNLIGINYPASFWPIPFPGWCRSGPGGCEKWNVSVEEGVSGLNAELIEQWTANPDENIAIFGYSQGGAVVSNEMRNLANLSPELKEQLQIVMIGNIENPMGGLWPRLNILNILGELLLDATLGPPMITDTGIATTNIGFQYDPVAYSPKYWGNPLAVMNALAGLLNVHGRYLLPNGGSPEGTMPYGYTDAELAAALADPDNIRYGGNDPTSDNKYIMIPAKSLPLADLILSLADATGTTPFVKPLVDLFEPIAKVIVDLGYDFSGDPNVPQGLSVLPFNPFQNWVEVGSKLVAAAGEGIQAFLKDLGLGATLAPSPAPALGTTTTVSTLAAASEAEPLAATSDAESLVTTSEAATAVTESDSESEETTAAPTLKVVPDVDEATVVDEATEVDEAAVVDDATVEEDEAAEDETTPATDEEPATKPEDETESNPSGTTPDSSVDEDATKDDDTKDVDEKKDDEKKDEAKKDEAKKADDTKAADDKKDEAKKADEKKADEKAAA
jgi:hypothetical protein